MSLRDDIQRAYARALSDAADAAHDMQALAIWEERAAQAQREANLRAAEAAKAAQALGLTLVIPKLPTAPEDQLVRQDWSET